MGFIKGKWNKDATLDFPCPECGQKTNVNITKLIEERAYDCGGCKKRVAITGNALDELRGLKEAIESFK